MVLEGGAREVGQVGSHGLRHSPKSSHGRSSFLVIEAKMLLEISSFILITLYNIIHFIKVKGHRLNFLGARSVLHWMPLRREGRTDEAESKEGDDYPARVYIIFEYDSDWVGFVERLKYETAKMP
jgi:hypothetical protein